MAKKFPKSALKEINVIEGRMILKHWVGIPTEEVINLIMPEKILAALEDHQECFLLGDLDADFFTHLSPDTVPFLRAIREYMEGTRPRVPKRAGITETLELGTDGEEQVEEDDGEGEEGEEESAEEVEEVEEVAEVKKEEPAPTAEERKMALRTRAFGIKAEKEPEPEKAAPLDAEGLEAKVDAALEGLAAVQAQQETTHELLVKVGRVLTFLVSEGILEQATFEDLDELHGAING